MGEIVAAVGTCHTPYLFTNPPDENPEQLKQAATAMRELGNVLDETKPDVILFLGADHVETFSVTCIPSFCIVAGDRAVAKFAGRTHDLPIHREMAEDVLNKLVSLTIGAASRRGAELAEEAKAAKLASEATLH